MYASLLVLFLARVTASPAALESVYGQVAYPVVSRVLGIVFGYWPGSASAVGLGLLCAYLLTLLAIGLIARSTVALRFLAVAVLRTAAVLALFFLANWGFNYGRPSVPERLGIYAAGPRDLLPTDTLLLEYARTAATVNRLRASLKPSGSFTATISVDSAAVLVTGLRATLLAIGYPTVPARDLRVLPKGLLLRFGTAGVYSPWTGDPHIDGGLHPLQQTFTATHELAHQQGITDEGDCNLLAYLTGIRSSDPRVRYAAELTYLRYLRAAIFRRDRVAFAGLSPKLSERVSLDLREIRAAQDRFEEIAPAARDAIYDGYLKTQGVQDGLSSYGRIIDHVVAGRRVRPGLFGGTLRG